MSVWLCGVAGNTFIQIWNSYDSCVKRTVSIDVPFYKFHPFPEIETSLGYPKWS
jgi:hypothetical protein